MIPIYQKNVLQSWMKLRGKTQENVAAALDMNVATMSKKINGISEFKLCEIQRLAEVLDLTATDIINIFFA